MAQVIKIKEIKEVPGSDSLGVVTLEPFGLQVVVKMAEFSGHMHAIFLPVGTKIPTHDSRFDFILGSTIQPKEFFGIVSQGVLVPYYWLPIKFRMGTTADLAVASGMNVGSLLGCESVNGTMHFGGSLTAEVVNSTGEVVGLFARGEIILAKEGRSNLVGPMAANGVIVANVVSGDFDLRERIEEFGRQSDIAHDTQKEAIRRQKATKAAMIAAAAGQGDICYASAMGIAGGFKVAANTALEAAEDALTQAFGLDVAEKFIPFLTAFMSVRMSNEFTRQIDQFLQILSEQEQEAA